MTSFVDSFLFPVPFCGYSDKDFTKSKLLWIDNKTNGNTTGYNIPCLYLKSKDTKDTKDIKDTKDTKDNTQKHLLLLWCHGNAADIGHMYGTLKHYKKHLRTTQYSISILAFEYPGYGLSKGVSSEEGVNMHANSALQYAVSTLGWNKNNIIVYGHSIGSGPACKLAADNKDLGGLILQSPYTSVNDIIDSKIPFITIFIHNRWINISQISKIVSPVLLIHGIKDTLIPATHSQSLYEACPSKDKYLYYDKTADHNSFNVQHMLLAINDFIIKILPKLSMVSITNPTTANVQINAQQDSSTTTYSSHVISSIFSLSSLKTL